MRALVNVNQPTQDERREAPTKNSRPLGRLLLVSGLLIAWVAFLIWQASG